MKKRASLLLKASGIRCVFGSTLLLLVGGCEPLNERILAEFILDFAREALAAWLL
jgi:hypothetical protein